MNNVPPRADHVEVNRVVRPDLNFHFDPAPDSSVGYADMGRAAGAKFASAFASQTVGVSDDELREWIKLEGVEELPDPREWSAFVLLVISELRRRAAKGGAA